MRLKKKGKRDKKEYYEYLRSSKWKEFRLNALNYYGWSCGKCEGKTDLQVHHKNYKNLFNETFDDVMILCKSCHRQHHKTQLNTNGKKSRYMRNPHYDTAPVTYFIKPKPL